MSNHTRPAGTPVLLGLGANLGDPPRQLARAVDLLGGVVTVEAVSSVWRSAPVGHADQPDFFNLVLAGRTTLSPEALLDAAQEVEARLGRRRSFRNAPRPIDVDLLDHGRRILRTERLLLPHPGIPSRAFVLRPLAEVAPGWRHPELGAGAAELLARAGTLERIERWGPLPSAGGAGPPLADPGPPRLS